MGKKYTADTFEGAVTGTASGNVAKTGDTMSGKLNVNYQDAEIEIRNNNPSGSRSKLTFGTLMSNDQASVQLNNSSSNLEFRRGAQSSTPKMTIQSSAVYFANPLRIGADASANELDDYEEGTYTPGVFGYFGGLTNVSFTTQLGKYIKIGRIVHCFFGIDFTGSPASNNILGLNGLPFVPSNDGNAYGGGSIGVAYKNRWNFVYTAGGGADSLLGVRKLGTASTLFFNMDDGNATNSMRVDALTGDTSNVMSIVAHITYRTTS